MKSWDCDVKPALERMSFSVLIPARLASSRLPNKPLADINGVPMVVRVAQRALQSKAVRTVVAADSAAIMARCSAFGIQSVLTRVDHPSGSDRLAEACSLLGLADDAWFSSELTIARYLLPVVFGGIGVNLISHVLLRHLTEAEGRFDREHSDR